MYLRTYRSPVREGACTYTVFADIQTPGITIISAAGNENQDVNHGENYPCLYPEVECIGAVDRNYNKMHKSTNIGSNYGSAIGYLAPGDDIISCGIAGPNAYTTWSGTSQAAPHAAGAAAIFTSWLGSHNHNSVSQFLYFNALTGITSGGWPSSPATVRRLVNTGFGYLPPFKRPNEPFRFAQDVPGINVPVPIAHAAAVVAPSVTPSPAPSSSLMTTFGTVAVTSTCKSMSAYALKPRGRILI